MKLKISRKRWLRGEEDSYLLRSKDNKMCCLGFLAKACKITNDSIRDIENPCSINDPTNKNVNRYIKKLTIDNYYNNQTCIKLIKTNDDIKISNKSREEKLTKLFKEIDVDVTFED